MIQLKELLHVSNRQKQGFVILKIMDEVDVHTDAYAYDVLSLIVDLGQLDTSRDFSVLPIVQEYPLNGLTDLLSVK